MMKFDYFYEIDFFSFTDIAQDTRIALPPFDPLRDLHPQSGFQLERHTDTYLFLPSSGSRDIRK